MIKAVLKRNNILLSEFADNLNISRPTLDAYIRNYDAGVRLSNNLFQKIFDFLFSDVQMSPEDFQRRYVYVLENYGKKTDMSSYSQSAPQSSSGESNGTSVAQAVYDVLSEDLILEKFTKDEYNVLAKLLMNDNGLLHCIFKYFLLWKGKVKLTDLNEPEKVMAINLFIFDKKLQGKDFTYSEEEYRGLKLAIDKKLNPSKYTTEQEQRAIDEISGSISSLLANNSGLSIDEIIAQIKKKI
jgi:transcriptional regulator with XRE-family HTH domain